MLITPLGKIKIYVDGIPADYQAIEYAFDRPPCKEQPVAGCYRIEVSVQGRRNISCVAELECSEIPNTGGSGESYLNAEFVKDNLILTIGMEDDNPAFTSVRTEYGLECYLLKPMESIKFGIAWATDYEGSYDVRTWYAADPTIHIPRKVYGAVVRKGEAY